MRAASAASLLHQVAQFAQVSETAFTSLHLTDDARDRDRDHDMIVIMRIRMSRIMTALNCCCNDVI